MLNGIKTLNEWLGTITELLKSLVVVGIVVGILFDDFFGVIAGLGRIMSQFGDAGFAGIANPIPIEPEDPGAMIAVLIPITFPSKLNSGPPEFPWFIDASV